MLRSQRGWFTDGRSKFLDRAPWGREPTAKVYVEIRIGDLPHTAYAQLDTGAAWSILAPDLALNAGIDLEEGYPALLSTRLGLLRGHIVRVPFTLIAEEGKSLQTEGSFFVPPEWPEKTSFLGYSGFLDSIRFALDPQVNDFYFGPC